MSFIVESISGDRRIQLGAEEIVRPMAIGTNWTKLRIGIRAGLWYAGGNFSNAVLALGVCQGQNGFISTNTVDYFGVVAGSAMLSTWTITTTSQPFAYTPAGAVYFRKTGQSVVSSTAGSATGPFFTCNPQQFRSQFFFDITKGATTYTFSSWGFNAFATSQTDVSRAVFLQALENEVSPTSLTNLFASQTIAYSGSGLFDSVSLYWNRSTPTMEISDLAVCRYL